MQNFQVPESDMLGINVLMQTLIAKYITWYFHKPEPDTDYAMYTDDVAYNVNVLQQFNKTGDLDVLYDGIMLQDTIVREHFVKVLEYVDEVRFEHSPAY